LEAATDKKEKALTNELASRKATQDELAKELTSRDAYWNQISINRMLTWGVYGMVAAIILAIGLLCLLMFRPNELGRSIVQDRVLIEILSMGFLLLTVIILGTGKLLNTEGLAALLGTIAGYIFGRKAAEVTRPPRGNVPVHDAATLARRHEEDSRTVWGEAENQARASHTAAIQKRREVVEANQRATAAEADAAAASPERKAEATQRAVTARGQADQKNREATEAEKLATEQRNLADTKKKVWEDAANAANLASAPKPDKGTA
jgi:hypothetical protein